MGREGDYGGGSGGDNPGGSGGDGGDWFDTQPPPPGGTAFDDNAVRAAYRQYLGRDPSAAELQAHHGNPGGSAAVVQLIKDSPEAKDYTAHGGGGPQGGDYQGWIMQQLEGKPFNQQALLDHEADWRARGIILQPANAQGERTKVQLPNGQIVRLGFGEGHPVWVVQSGPGGGGAAPNPTMSPAPPPYASTPWTGGDYTPPPLPDDLQHEFVAPTQAEVEASPGYQTRLDTGRLTRERAASARGTLSSGGTLKALERYAQDYASNEYSNVYGQRLSTRNQNYSEYQGAVGVGQQTYMNRYNAWADENGRTRTDYTLNNDTRRNWENDYWARLRDLYRGGLDASL